MKLSALFFLFSFSMGAFAADSCQLAINTDDLGLSVVEKAKLELQMKKKDYEFAFKMNLKAGFGAQNAGYGLGFNEKLLYLDQIKLTDKLSEKGEPLFEITSQKVASYPDMDGGYKVDIEKTLKPGSEVEIILKDMNYDVKKILKPKKKLLGLGKDKGSPGYVLLAGLVRDLPKCENTKAIDDSGRASGKDAPANSFNFGSSFGTTVYGY